MQRMEVIIRHVDEEDQVLSESSMSFQTLDVDSILREERLDQLESDTLDKGHEIMRHMFLSQCQLADQQLAEKRQHSGSDYASPQSQDQKLAKLRWIINPLNL